jgi:heme oxygenase
VTKLIELLRENTAAVHKQLDGLSVTKRVLSPQVSVNDYLNYLSAFYPIYASVEKNIYKNASQYLPDIEKNARINTLEKDLRFHNVAMNDLGKWKNQSIVTPSFSSFENIGALYVLEGSRLGGKLIHKHLSFALNSQISTDFLLEPPVVSWATILRYLDQIPLEEHHAIVHAANRMFIFVHDALSQWKDIDFVRNEVSTQ